MHCNWCAVFCHSCKHSVHSIAGKETFCSFSWGTVTLFRLISDLIVVFAHNAEIYDFLYFGFNSNILIFSCFSGLWIWEWLSSMTPNSGVLWCCRHMGLQSAEAVSRPQLLADYLPKTLAPFHVVLIIGCLSILMNHSWFPQPILEREPKTKATI